MVLVKLGNWELRVQWYGNGADIWHVECPTWKQDGGWDYRSVQAVGMRSHEDVTKCWYCNRPVPPEMQVLAVFYNK